MLPDVGIALAAQEFQGKKRQEVIAGRNHLGPGQTCRLYHFVKAKLCNKGSEQEDTGSGGFKTLPFELPDGGEGFGALRHLRPSYGQAQLKTRTARKLCKPFFRKHTFHGTYRKLQSLSTEELNDLSGGKPLFSPGNDLAARLGAHLVTGGFVLLRDLRQVDLAVSELMAEQPHIAWRETESLGHESSGQPIDKEGTKGLVATLPRRYRLSEEGSISHDCYHNMTLISVNTKIQNEMSKGKKSERRWDRKSTENSALSIGYTLNGAHCVA